MSAPLERGVSRRTIVAFIHITLAEKEGSVAPQTSRAWWIRLIHRVVDVKPEERVRAWTGFFTLFGLVVTHELLETTRHAVFLQQLPATRLPYAYLALAVAAMIWSLASRRMTFGRTTKSLSTSLVLSALGIGGLWLWHGSGNGIYPYVLYLSTSLIVPIWMVAFWIEQSTLWTVLEAKRIFSMFAIGGLLGNIAGAALAGTLGDRFGTASLLIASIAVLSVTVLGARRIERETPVSPALTEEAPEPVDSPTPKSYVSLLLLIAILAAVATKLGEFLFLQGVSSRTDHGSIAKTLAAASLVGSVGAMGVQLLITRWALRSMGVTRAVAILPVLYSAGAAWCASGSMFHAPMALRIVDGALRQPVYRSAMELLFMPLSDAARGRAKTWVDIAGQRAGQAIASLLILGLTLTGLSNPGLMGGLTLGVALCWAAVTPLLHRDYLQLFRLSLSRSPRGKTQSPDELEPGSVLALLSSLHREDDPTTLAALELIVDAGAADQLPASLLSRKTVSIVIRSLEVGPSQNWAWRKRARGLLSNPDPQIRASALRFLGGAALARAMLSDPDVRVRTTALVLLSSENNQGEILDSLTPHDKETQLAFITTVAAGGPPAPHLEPVLVRLAQRGVPEVQDAVVHLAIRHPVPSLLPFLVELTVRSESRGAARQAIATIGPASLKFLVESLADESASALLRRHLPATIAHLQGPAAARALLQRYPIEKDDRVRGKLLKALLWMVDNDPSLVLDDTLLSAAIDRTLARGARLRRWIGVLEGFVETATTRVTASEHLTHLLSEQRARILSRALTLLELRHPDEDYGVIRVHVTSADRARHAQAVELLRNIAPPELRPRLMDLCTDEARPELDTTLAGLEDLAREHAAVLAEMELWGNEAVRLLARCAIEESEPPKSSLRPDEPTLPATEAALWLRKVPLFEFVDSKGLGILAAHVTEGRYAPEAQVQSASSSGQSIVVVVAGVLEVTGKRETVESGAILGERRALGDTDDRSEECVARNTVRTLELSTGALAHVLRHNYDIFLSVARKLALDAIAAGATTPTPSTDFPVLGGSELGFIDRMEVLTAVLPVLAGHVLVAGELASTMVPVRYEAGSALSWPTSFSQRTFAIVTDGALERPDRSVVGTGSVVGLLDAVAGREADHFTAKSDSSIVLLQIDDLLDAFEEEPALQLPFLRFLLSKRTNSDTAELAA